MLWLFYDRQLLVLEGNWSRAQLTHDVSVEIRNDYLIVRQGPMQSHLARYEWRYIPTQFNSFGRIYLPDKLYIQQAVEVTQSAWLITGNIDYGVRIMQETLEKVNLVLPEWMPLAANHVSIPVPVTWPRLCLTSWGNHVYLTIVSVPDPRVFFQIIRQLNPDFRHIYLDPSFRCGDDLELLTFLRKLSELHRASDTTHRFVLLPEHLTFGPTFPWHMLCSPYHAGEHNAIWWQSMQLYVRRPFVNTVNVFYLNAKPSRMTVRLPVEMVMHVFRFLYPSDYAYDLTLYAPRRTEDKNQSWLIRLFEQHPDLWYDELRDTGPIPYRYETIICATVPKIFRRSREDGIHLLPKTHRLM